MCVCLCAASEFPHCKTGPSPIYFPAGVPAFATDVYTVRGQMQYFDPVVRTIATAKVVIMCPRN